MIIFFDINQQSPKKSYNLLSSNNTINNINSNLTYINDYNLSLNDFNKTLDYNINHQGNLNINIPIDIPAGIHSSRLPSINITTSSIDNYHINTGFHSLSQLSITSSHISMITSCNKYNINLCYNIENKHIQTNNTSLITY